MILSFKTAASRDLTICNWISGRVVSPWKQSQMVSMARSMRGACSAPSWATVRCEGAEKYEYEMSLPMQSRAVVVRGIVPDLVASCNGAKTTSGSGSSLWFSLMASSASLTSSASCLFLPALAAMMSSESDTTFWRELMVGVGSGFGFGLAGQRATRVATGSAHGEGVRGGRGAVSSSKGEPILCPVCQFAVRDGGRRVAGRLGLGWLQRGRWLRCRGRCVLRRGEARKVAALRGRPERSKEDGGRSTVELVEVGVWHLLELDWHPRKKVDSETVVRHPPVDPPRNAVYWTPTLERHVRVQPHLGGQQNAAGQLEPAAFFLPSASHLSVSSQSVHA